MIFYYFLYLLFYNNDKIVLLISNCFLVLNDCNKLTYYIRLINDNLLVNVKYIYGWKKNFFKFQNCYKNVLIPIERQKGNLVQFKYDLADDEFHEEDIKCRLWENELPNDFYEELMKTQNMKNQKTEMKEGLLQSD